MKKSVLLLLAAVSLISLTPSAQAYDHDAWRSDEKELRALDVRIEHIRAWRDRWGAGPRLAAQIAQINYELAELTNRIQGHAGDPKIARKNADNLADLMAQVELEYRARAHREGFVIEVYH